MRTRLQRAGPVWKRKSAPGGADAPACTEPARDCTPSRTEPAAL